MESLWNHHQITHRGWHLRFGAITGSACDRLGRDSGALRRWVRYDDPRDFCMGKLWKITIFNGNTMENHHFHWENYAKSPFSLGKLWKITIFNGKTLEHHNFYSFVMGKKMLTYTIFDGFTMIIAWFCHEMTIDWREHDQKTVGKMVHRENSRTSPDQRVILPLNHWKFQDPKMSCYGSTICLAIFFGHLPWNIGLKNRPYIWYLQSLSSVAWLNWLV